MTLKNRLLVVTLCAALITGHVASTETSWSPDWADDLSVRVHPTVGVRTVDDPSATGVIDGAWRSDKDIELATIKHVPHKDTVIIRVPPSALIKANDTVALTLHVARLIGMQRRCALNATPLEGDLDCDSGTLLYIRDVTRRPHMNLAPGLTLSESVAKACLAAHPLKLYRAARSQWQQLLGAAEKGTSKLHATRKELVLAWSIVRTRAISGPTVASAPDSSTQIMLVPLIDLANHDASDVATAKLEFQRHSEGASMNDDGTVIPNKRSDQLDVLLVTTRSLKKGTPITISYGNLRHPVDAVDTYGFLVPGFDSDRGKLDERIRALFPALPVQIGFPRDDTFFGPRGCSDEWRMVFNATTGRPADDVLPCASLAQLKGLGEAQGLIAMQTYANGRMDKKERRQLAKAAWGLLAQSAGKLRDEEYALTADNREACAALMTSASPRVVKVVSMATAATMFMRDAVGRLQTYCNEKVKQALSTQAPKPPTTTPPPSEL